MCIRDRHRCLSFKTLSKPYQTISVQIEHVLLGKVYVINMKIKVAVFKYISSDQMKDFFKSNIFSFHIKII